MVRVNNVIHTHKHTKTVYYGLNVCIYNIVDNDEHNVYKNISLNSSETIDTF